MPIAEKLLAHFEPDEFYHIICKSIDGKKLFSTDANRMFFLNRYNEFSNGFADTYAYCLLDNHVHWLIKTLPEDTIIGLLRKSTTCTQTQTKFINVECTFHELIEQQFNRLFISYSLAYNKSLGIKGHLFSRPFKRIAVANDQQLTQLIIYIHANAQKHGICNDFRTFKWSSYLSILSAKPTHLKRDEVLEWFGNREKYIEIHKDQSDYYYNNIFSGE
ncbi:MAG TPA: hypothetical protein PK504_13840 [Ferruginibacter sp.]|nr:hypothetical protein [Ferruginibacter sp.]